MTEDLKKALSYVAFGALFTLVNFNLTFNNGTVNVMPDFIGWFLFFMACDRLGAYTEDKKYLKWMALALVIFSLTIWIGEMFMPELDFAVLESATSLISTLFMFLLFSPLEQLAADFGSKRGETLHMLRYFNLVLGAAFLVFGIVYRWMNIYQITGIFVILGLIALASAIVSMITLFGLRKELTKERTL